MKVSAEQRFWAKVQKTDSCWLWMGGRTGDGYGSLSVNGSNVKVHRFSYELMRGPIPIDLTIDHLCRVRHCVNPDHLEPVTNRENILRGIAAAAVNARKSECIRGHSFSDPAVLYQRSAHKRVCRVCRRNNRNRSRIERRALGLPRDAARDYADERTG